MKYCDFVFQKNSIGIFFELVCGAVKSFRQNATQEELHKLVFFPFHVEGFTTAFALPVFSPLFAS